jgi:hypothetical protein
VLDEVDQAAVGPLEVLEDEHGGRGRGDPLEEGPPGGEEGVAPAGRGIAGAEEGEEGRLDPGRSAGSGTNLASIAAIPVRVAASSSVSARRARCRIISPRAQNVTPSP